MGIIKSLVSGVVKSSSGAISKIKDVGAKVKPISGVLGKASTAVNVVKAVAGRINPVVAGVTLAPLAWKTGTKIGSLARKVTGKDKPAPSTITPSIPASKESLMSKLTGFAKENPLITAGIVATTAYAGEQIAEKLGVRGGAGFIGRRKKRKSKKSKKSRRRSSRRSRRSSRRTGKRVSFTTKDGRKVSFMPRSGGRRTRRRQGRINKTERRLLSSLRRQLLQD